MVCELKYEIKKLLDSQQGLEVDKKGKEYIIQGLYKYSLDYNGCIIQGKREIKLVVQDDFPNSIPKLYISNYPEHIEHIYTDGNVCLATTGEMIYFLNENPSLISFINRFVNSFIYTLDWFDKYKTYPFGDRKHGYRGSIDYYLNDLKLTESQYKKWYG